MPTKYQEIIILFIILIRVSCFLFMFPFFSARIIPIKVKAGLSLLVTIILFPVVRQYIGKIPDTPISIANLILTEMIIGMIIGLSVTLFFEGIRIMGQLVGYQTGFAITNIIDPQSTLQVSIFANFAYLVAVLLFLAMNGHHIFLIAIKESFSLIPPGEINLSNILYKLIIKKSCDMFIIAVKIGAPAIAALLFTQVAFGLVNKFIPQINIMFVAFPIQIIIGLIFFGISLSLVSWTMYEFNSSLWANIIKTIKLIKI